MPIVRKVLLPYLVIIRQFIFLINLKIFAVYYQSNNVFPSHIMSMKIAYLIEGHNTLQMYCEKTFCSNTTTDIQYLTENRILDNIYSQNI